MPNKRISMMKLREVIRLKAAGLTLRPIARATGLSLGAVSKYLTAAQRAQLSWPLPADLTDLALSQRLFGFDGATHAPGSASLSASPSAKPAKYAAPDCPAIHQELKRDAVTLQLLWQEYRQEHSNNGAALSEGSLDTHPAGRAAGGSADRTAGLPYGYSQYCVIYRTWAKTLKRSMRQTHRAGEKLFVDYAGQTLAITDAATGEIKQAQVFVAVLGASNYTYAEATLTQRLPDWLGSHARALAFFGGVPQIVVPDNLKSGVTTVCRYEPEINRSYTELASHYGFAVIPARPYKPKDKAKVEVGVQIVQRWILAALRKQRFFSLTEANTAIHALLTLLNDKAFKKLPGSRKSAFEALDQPALRPLPSAQYEYALWKRVRVNIDYHVEYEGHYYSVPHALVGRELDLRVTLRVVECLEGNQRVASHPRSTRRGTHTTVAAHMPATHRAHMRWTPGKLLNWAHTIGVATHAVVDYQLTHKPHPEMGYRACLGLLSLSKKYGVDRLEAACQRAVAIGSLTRKSVLSILQAGLDRIAPISPVPSPHVQQGLDLRAQIGDTTHTQNGTSALVAMHHNVRGAQYYH
jgi:transposase